MTFARRCAAAVLVLLCVAAAWLWGSGCGGKSVTSNSSGSTTTASAGASASRFGSPGSGSLGQQFVARADEICRKANVQLAKSKLKAKSTPAAATTVVVENETIERKAVGELAGLTPPSAVAPAWAKVLGLRRSLANRLGDFATAIKRGETKFIALSKSKKQLHAQLASVARKAGLRDCAKIG